MISDRSVDILLDLRGGLLLVALSPQCASPGQQSVHLLSSRTIRVHAPEIIILSEFVRGGSFMHFEVLSSRS